MTNRIIKHAPGDDQYGYEDAGERWMPVHSVESIVWYSSAVTSMPVLMIWFAASERNIFVVIRDA